VPEDRTDEGGGFGQRSRDRVDAIDRGGARISPNGWTTLRRRHPDERARVMRRIRSADRRRAMATRTFLALMTAFALSASDPARAATVERDGFTVRRAVASLVPSNGARFGVFAQPTTGWDRDDQRRAVIALERDLGRRFDIDHYFYSFFRPFSSWRQAWDLRQGRVPMISWNGTYTDQIVSGSHDDLIRARARAVRALDDPVFLRFFWEMDGDEKAHWISSPDGFVDAWRHVVHIFREVGATNAAWVWCPNAWAFEEGSADAYYPGDGYVDWICADGYNFAPGRPGFEWRSFREIFRAAHRWTATTTDKPLMIGETGAQEREPGEKAAWIRGARRVIAQRFHSIRAFVYFNSGSQYPWWVTSSESAYREFVAMGRRPYFDRP
jgi:hypothetical protein